MDLREAEIQNKIHELQKAELELATIQQKEMRSGAMEEHKHIVRDDESRSAAEAQNLITEAEKHL